MTHCRWSRSRHKHSMCLTPFEVGTHDRTYLDGVDRFRSPFIMPMQADDRGKVGLCQTEQPLCSQIAQR